MKKILTIIFIVIFALPLIAQTDDKSKEIDELKKRIEELEKQLEELKKSTEDETDEALEKELAAELYEEKPAQTPAQSSTYQAQGSKNTNPSIGVIGNFLGMKLMNPSDEHHEEEEEHGNEENGHGHGHSEPKDGFVFQEAEVSMQMVIDTYAKADFFVAVHPDVVELEEAYITLLSLPYSFQLKAGKFRSNFGKLNLIHPPEAPFADYPLMLTNYFGEEGLVETGVSVSTLISNPWDKYVELRAEITNGNNGISFNGDETGDLLYLGYLKTFFDLTDNSSLEIGFTGITGVNDSLDVSRSNIGGVNLSYRWKPLRYSRYKSFTLQTEVLFSQRETPSIETINTKGYFVFSEYQVAKRWFIGGRYDYSERPDDSEEHENAYSGFLTFWPSEFQTLRGQYRRAEDHDGESSGTFFFQWTFTIGKHGAHVF